MAKPDPRLDDAFTLLSLDEQRHLAYFPRQKSMVETDGAGKDALDSWKEGRLDFDATFLRELRSLALLEFEEPVGSTLEPQPYLPTAVTLFPTFDCNLRCIYCYSSAGERRAYMDPSIGKAAINFIVANALVSGSKQVSVTFHGGGEPTLNWPLIKEVTAYVRILAKAAGLEAHVSCGTNGCFSETKRDWLLDNLDSICLSLDGLEAVQDRQRPKAGGKGSFAGAFRTLQRCESKGFPYQIRTTVTKTSLLSLKDFIVFLAEHAPHASLVQLEPLSAVGRALDTEEPAPSPDEFLEAFLSLRKLGEELGCRVAFAGCDITAVRDSFCGAYGSNFIVTPTGEVTTCYEVSDPTDFRWPIFHVGHYDRQLRRFEWNEKALRALHEHKVTDLDACRGCIARCHCAGDCPARRLLSGESRGSAQGRCHVMRELVRDQVLRTAQSLARRTDDPSRPPHQPLH